MKSNTIRKELMLKIAKAHEKFPDTPYRLIASEFNVTVRQVSYAVSQYKKDQLEVITSISKAKKEKLKAKVNEDIIEQLKNKTAKELLKELFETLVISVKANEKMADKEKLNYLKDLMSISKQILAIDLSTQIKDPDVERIATMIRLIKPEATDEFIIEIWKRACELHKIA